MKVITAIEEDLDELVALGERMIDEAVVPIPSIDKERVRRILFSDEAPKHMTCLIAVDDNGVICGFMVATLSDVLFSDAQFASHHIFFVQPESRGSSAAYKLVDAYEYWAIGLGAVYLEIAIDTGLMIERTSRFYNKLGYHTIGAKFVKAVIQQPNNKET